MLGSRFLTRLITVYVVICGQDFLASCCYKHIRDSQRRLSRRERDLMLLPYRFVQ
jgi:hypothetical protein